MNVIVCVKQVLDNSSPVKIAKDGRHIDGTNTGYIINPCDLAAVKWATNWKERSKSGEVAVISKNGPSTGKILRECFAYGADRALLLTDLDFEDSDGFATGLILARAIKLLEYDIILCGIQAVDTNDGWVGPVVANKLGIPLISRVIDIQVDEIKKKVTVRRRLDGVNREIVEADVPCLLTVDSLLDEPRYASIRSIRMAQRREIEQHDRISLGLSKEDVGTIGSKTSILELFAGKLRPGRIFIPDSSLPAAERIRLIMSGGITEKRENRLEGNPEETIPDLIQFLRQKKIIR
ncbi:MAG TPA: electron transfer flavoprotein subunit beta/FixA family protein [Dehalococcoidia bacterium]|nr:electron transfer flavoprotein subunit beta/FixA family protein [Dehalococcoidia bacterium]